MTNYKDVRYNFTGANLTGIPTSAVTTGTFANARLSSGNVTQHVTTYNDTKIKDDIATLGLKSAIADNKTAHNFTNAFIEQFQDDTGIDNETQGDRDSSEFWWPTGQLAEVSYPSNTSSFTSVANASNPGSYSSHWAFESGYGSSQFATSSGGAGGGNAAWNIGQDFGSGNEKILRGYSVDVATGGGTFGNGGPLAWTFVGSQNADLSSPTTFDTVSDRSGLTNPYNSATFANTTAFRYYALKITQSGTNNFIYITEIDMKVMGVYSTGSFTCNNQTADATVSKGGIIVLYKNNAGTATLNTDLVAKISANGGTNYETVTLAALGTFSTGILMASAQNVTISNTGTAMKYQISFANQSTGSKETQVHGVSLLY